MTRAPFAPWISDAVDTPPHRHHTAPPRPTVAVLIRFADSAQTLPGVLAALQAQTLQPHAILGVDSGSRDGSAQLIRDAGGRVIVWPQRYEHAKVLNFGLRHLEEDLVLLLSSHTVLEDPETLARMVAAMEDARTACVSLKWYEDPYYSDAIDWHELKAKGLKFGSIHSNSMGMIRRSLWERHPFEESLDTAEDYAWAMDMLDLGLICRRLALPFRYQRSGHNRDFEFARIVFELASAHGLPVAWPGVKATLRAWLGALRRADPVAALYRARLTAWWRVHVA